MGYHDDGERNNLACSKESLTGGWVKRLSFATGHEQFEPPRLCHRSDVWY